MASNDDGSISAKDVCADDSIIHERQSLQLCAVHAINNLLQISTDNTSNEGWMCGSCKLNEQPSWTRATKTELDEIADALTIAESHLMVEDNDGNNNAPPQAISLYQKLSSQHRTILFGRYSFEVMQMALKRRDVNLSWFSPSKTGNVDSLLHAVNDSEDDSSQIVIGFIVNNVNKTSIWTRMPLVSRWYGDGRHWFAITGLQRTASSNNNNNNASKWKVLDSMTDEPILLDSDLELLELLTSIVENGGNVFRAVISI